jgi:alpha-tubulin suppressor-like RCC1 family protein
MCGENTNNRLFLDTRRKTIPASDTFRPVLEHQIPGGDIIDVAVGQDRSLVLTAGGEVWTTTAGEDRTPVRLELGGRGAFKAGVPGLRGVGVSEGLNMAATVDGTGDHSLN